MPNKPKNQTQSENAATESASVLPPPQSAPSGLPSLEEMRERVAAAKRKAKEQRRLRREHVDLLLAAATRAHPERTQEENEREFVVQWREPHMKIDFNEQKITGITQSDLDGWRDRYPAVNLELALQKALDWVLRNGVQLRNADLFLERWLFRSQYGFEEA